MESACAGSFENYECIGDIDVYKQNFYKMSERGTYLTSIRLMYKMSLNCDLEKIYKICITCTMNNNK